MKSQIKILLEPDKSNKAKGNCFENLIRKLVEIHHYNVKGNINFVGMEIDLVAEHKHKRETLYAECKAKDKVSSDELSKFCFNVSHRRADVGYFFRTDELEHQAGAFLEELKVDERYKNLTFFEPRQIIEMLSDSRQLHLPTTFIKGYIISKQILVISYIGDFFLYLINETNAFPTKFLIINANDNSATVTNEEVEILQSRIDEIETLHPIFSESNRSNRINSDIHQIPETISEVQESENWYDYLPASSNKNHFVGRDKIRTSIMKYFKAIRDQKTQKRLFYLNGKSGWGKSSLVLELKGRCQNVHFRNKFYSVAIDTRSATSNNFVALSFKKVIEKALLDKFIELEGKNFKIDFISNFDLLSSASIGTILDYLKAKEKYIILIFDQFEDVFRKNDLFKSFYKFLSDVTDSKPNIIVGFSWRSEIIIPIDHEAYFYWQQAKEQAREFTIGEFGEKEIDGIILQLEQSVGHLDRSIKNRIKESSQGLPWLTKKLCIHIYEQIDSGLPKEGLLDSNLNIKNLFKKDEERIEAKELTALRLIARRAYEGNFFDETEVGELISSNVITSLLHKRLIIRSGANYNIYWDIFRDYLVTSNIPIIGESYLLRHMVASSLETFMLFEEPSREVSIELLSERHPKGISGEGLYNILIELRSIGIVQKNGEYFSVIPDVKINEESFKQYVREKFQNYTPFLKLKKLKQNVISKEQVVKILKDTFKQDFQENTWNAYANTLISWSRYVEDLEVEIASSRIKNLNILKSSYDTVILRHSPSQIFSLLPLIEPEINNIHRKFLRDLFLLGIIDEKIALTELGKKMTTVDIQEQKSIIINQAAKLPQIIKISEFIKNKNKFTAREIIDGLKKDFFSEAADSSRLVYAHTALLWVKKFDMIK